MYVIVCTWPFAFEAEIPEKLVHPAALAPLTGFRGSERTGAQIIVKRVSREEASRFPEVVPGLRRMTSRNPDT